MFKIFKNKELTDDELFSALENDEIKITEQDIQKARKNDTETLYKLGEIYYKDESYKKAFGWYYKAALRNHTAAQSQVGMMYRKGVGISSDYHKAKYWLIRAAKAGDVNAQYHTGGLYFTGLIHINLEQAMRWYLKAAENGSLKAMNRIGYMYYFGSGVTKSIPKAIEWYKKSANQGDRQAQYELGYLYKIKSEARNLQEAVNWYQKSADIDYKDAKDEVKNLNKKGIYCNEQRDKEYDRKVDMSSEKARTIENIDHQLKHSRDHTEASIDTKELEVHAQVAQEEADIREQERVQKMKENNRQLKSELTEKELKMRIEVLQKESDLREQERKQKNKENQQLKDEVAKLKALLQDNAINDIYYDSDDDKVDNKKDKGHDTERNVIHQKKTTVDSASNSVDLNYDSDDHYADPNYDSSDNEGRS